MTRGKHDEKSVARISAAKPGSREATAARKAAKRNGASGGNSEHKTKDQSSGNQGDGCQNSNRSGGRCSQYEPCDYHFDFANR